MAEAPKTLPADFFDQQQPAAAEAPKTLPADFFYSTTVTAKAPEKESALKRFGKGLWDSTVGGIPGTIKTIASLAHAGTPGNALDPEAMKAVGNIINAHADQFSKAKEAWNKGEHTEAAGHFMAGVLPLVGPAAAQAGEKIGNGDVAGGIGEGVGLLATMGAPEALGRVVGKAKDIPVVPKLGARNATEAAALDYLDQAGVPVSAGVRTGNAFVRGTEKLMDHTPLGSVVAKQSEHAAAEGLQAEAGRLVDRAKPDVPSSQGYGAFEKAAENRRTWREVKVGKDDLGNDNFERMAMPVQIGDLRPLMGKIVDDFELASGIDRNSTAAYSVAKKFAEGPEYVPAPTAEKALSALKSLARESAGGAGVGTAKLLIPKLQDLIDGSVKASAGPDVMKALQQARTSAAAEFGVNWLENAFKKAEAEGGFNRAQGLWADWQRLSDADKTRIFRHPQLVDDINKFLLGAKKLAENPNPSGSAYIGAVAGQAALAVTNPVKGIPYVLGSGALAKMLHSPAASRALTNGIRVSLDSHATTAAKAAAAMNILRLAGDLAQPFEPAKAAPKAAQSSDPSQQNAPFALALPPQ